MDRITIIGVGPIGISIGLCLKAAELKETEIVATSGDRAVLKLGSEMNAFDKTSGNLKSALKGAQLVILDTALSETREIIEAIAPILEDKCILTDTGPSKVQVLKWAEEYLPDSVDFVSGRPIVKDFMDSDEDASVDAFLDSEYCIIPAKRVNQTSIKTIVGLVQILGAKPLFIDAAEHDSYFSATTQLPMLMAAALVNSVSSSSAWREISRLAGGEFKNSAQLSSGIPADNVLACKFDSASTIRWINQAIDELTKYKKLIEADSENLSEEFEAALDEWAKWQAGTIVPQDAPQIPSSGDAISGMFFGRRITQRFREVSKLRQSQNGNP